MIYFLMRKANCELQGFPLGTQSNNGLNYKFYLILVLQFLLYSVHTVCLWPYFVPNIDAIYSLFMAN